MNLSAYPHTVCLTGHEYMARSERLRRPGKGLEFDDQFNAKPAPSSPNREGVSG